MPYFSIRPAYPVGALRYLYGDGIRFALEAVHKQVSRYHAAGIDCYKPFVLMITDGAPTEDMAGIAELIAAREGEGRYGHLALPCVWR